MQYLCSENIRLRALEKADVDLLYRWENDTRVWGVSETLLPFSRHLLASFIEEQAKDIFQTRQYRFVIERNADSRAVGVIDLFDFDPFHLRAGVGILVHDPADRGKGYAKEALGLLSEYARDILRLHQLYCQIPVSNAASMRLFSAAGFLQTGTKRQWLRTAHGWEDTAFLQCLFDQSPETSLS